MRLEFEGTQAELDQLLSYIGGADMAFISRRLAAVEAAAAQAQAKADQVEAQVTDVAAQVAALQPNPQLAADVEQIKGNVAALNAILDVVDDQQP